MNEELAPGAILEALREVRDPETGVNLVDMGLVYDVAVREGGQVNVTMTLTSPACPAGGPIVAGVERRVSLVPGVSAVNVDLVFEPRWTPDRITEEGRRQLGW